jgi:integration host factor subunit alpha
MKAIIVSTILQRRPSMPDNRKKYKAYSQKTLTRRDLVRAVYDCFDGLPLLEARRLVDSVIEEMLASLALGETIKLHNFGVFGVRAQKERIGRNPRTGALAAIRARKTVVFKASPNLKAAITAGLQKQHSP